MYTVPPVQKVQSEKWLGNFCGAFGWVFVAYFGSIWFAVHAFMGNFEGFFWFIKTLRTWVPLAIVRSSELYYNRQNDAIFEYRATNYTPILSNWTNFPVKPNNGPKNTTKASKLISLEFTNI